MRIVSICEQFQHVKLWVKLIANFLVLNYDTSNTGFLGLMAVQRDLKFYPKLLAFVLFFK